MVSCWHLYSCVWLTASIETMSCGDSRPVFLQRARDVGLEDAVIKAFTDMHLDTMARFAFSCSYSPGGADDSPFKELIKTVLKREATLVEASCYGTNRGIFNEETCPRWQSSPTCWTGEEAHWSWNSWCLWTGGRTGRQVCFILWARQIAILGMEPVRI